MILGAAGNVGAYAVQFAARAGLHVVAAVTKKDTDYVRSLGAEIVLDSQTGTFEDSALQLTHASIRSEERPGNARLVL